MSFNEIRPRSHDIKPINFLTVDTEDWFQVFYGSGVIQRDQWATCESVIAPMLDATLALFEEHEVKATFFVVGWLARQFPSLVRQITAQGHEVASHGFWHQEVHRMTMDEFKKDIRLAKEVIEQALGAPVHGYRAPGFSISSAKHPAVDHIREAGYRYDSSVLGYAWAPYEIRPGLLEVPPNAMGWVGKYLPVNGGFVFRAIPYSIYRWYVKSLAWRGAALNFYTHTWEMYPQHPRIPMPFLKSFIQYFNTKSVKPKMERLLSETRFTSIAQACAAELSDSIHAIS